MSYVSMTKAGIAADLMNTLTNPTISAFSAVSVSYLWDNRKDSTTYQQHMVFDVKGRPHIAIVPPGSFTHTRTSGKRTDWSSTCRTGLYKGKDKPCRWMKSDMKTIAASALIPIDYRLMRFLSLARETGPSFSASRARSCKLRCISRDNAREESDGSNVLA